MMRGVTTTFVVVWLSSSSSSLSCRVVLTCRLRCRLRCRVVFVVVFVVVLCCVVVVFVVVLCCVVVVFVVVLCCVVLCRVGSGRVGSGRVELGRPLCDCGVVTVVSCPALPCPVLLKMLFGIVFPISCEYSPLLYSAVAYCVAVVSWERRVVVSILSGPIDDTSSTIKYLNYYQRLYSSVLPPCPEMRETVQPRAQFDAIRPCRRHTECVNTH